MIFGKNLRGRSGRKGRLASAFLKLCSLSLDPPNMQTEQQDNNPFRPPQTQFEVISEPQQVSRWLNLLLFLLLLTTIVGTIASFLKIESIMVSGVVASLFGVLTAVFGKRSKMSSIMWLGLSAPLFSMACFALIFFNDWSPADARSVIPGVILVYCGVTLCWLMFAFLDALGAEQMPQNNDAEETPPNS